MESDSTRGVAQTVAVLVQVLGAELVAAVLLQLMLGSTVQAEGQRKRHTSSTTRAKKVGGWGCRYLRVVDSVDAVVELDASRGVPDTVA